MYENIDMGCVSKSDFLVLCQDYVNERMEYEKSGNEIAFIKSLLGSMGILKVGGQKGGV